MITFVAMEYEGNNFFVSDIGNDENETKCYK